MYLPLAILSLISLITCQTTIDDYECGADDLCPDGWTQVTRTFGEWCIRVYEGVYSQDEAEAKCNLQNSTLSGAESVEERLEIAKLGKSYMETVTEWKYGSLRVGFRRCDFSKKWLLTDRYTIGIAAFGWAAGEPAKTYTTLYNNMNTPNNCAAMSLIATGGPNSTREHGTFYTVACSITGNDGFRGYVCGKPAVV